MPSDEHIYEERLLAFIDVLGFERLIDDSASDETIAIAAVRLLSQVQKFLSGKRDGQFSATCFSDTICVSQTASINTASFCAGLGLVATGFLGLGYAIRGSVTRGKLYHNDALILGPALNRAYRLEREIAVYPRIVIDPRITLHIEPELGRFQLLTQDVDGLDCVNYLSPPMIRTMFKLMGLPASDFRAEIRRNIEQLMRRAAGNDAAAQKIRWLNRYAERSFASDDVSEEEIDTVVAMARSVTPELRASE